MEDSRLARIEDKVDTVISKVSDINVTLAKQHEVLNEHQRRSAANEKAIELIRAYHMKWAVAIISGLCILAFELWRMRA